MERTVYGVLSRVAAVVLVLVGVAAIIGGTWAHGYVKNQLSSERITMPAGAALTNDDMKAALTKYAGTPLDNGPKAEAFANHYILEHMNASSSGKTYNEISGQYQTLSKDTNADPAQVKKLGDLRQSLFMGDTLRGMLLTAYAWWLVGTIALWAGIALVVIAVILGILGWGPLRSKSSTTA
ncbi:hypothetical protein [Raineyella sp.]|uniref:hypothetical protein n=1 Tax=Raineyella sp. TaxID=1911550 RepID=UPI002B20A7EA|nr:hypothetical protein [Raineyella sp.]MEA5153420.1 hypothetical protein [Raineyella sp.]